MPESVTDRARRSHEQWFHFTTQPRYFSAVDEIRETPAAYTRKGGTASYTAGGVHTNGVGSASLHQMSDKGALPPSVWTVATEPLQVPASLGTDHYAAFPIEFPRRIIQGWSPKDGTVLDPFGGTGTTAMVADVLGRHGISVDMSADYCRIAEWRTNDPGERARAARVAKPPAQTTGQDALFDI